PRREGPDAHRELRREAAGTLPRDRRGVRAGLSGRAGCEASDGRELCPRHAEVRARTGEIGDEPMPTRKVWLLIPLLSLPVTSLSAAAREGEYLFDTLKKPAYRRAWDAMLKGHHVDPWLAKFARTQNGVAAPKKTITIQGVTYQAGWVCKPHECG